MKPFSLFRAASAGHLRPDDLSRLAAHDLPERRARAVLRHLAACPVCQAEWQAVQTVWRAAATSAHTAAPAAPDALRERIWAAFALPPTPVAPERKFAMPAVFVRPLVGASLAAAAVAVVFGGALVYGPALVFRAPRAVAFSDVENAMAGIKTATWTQTVSVTMPPSASGAAQTTARVRQRMLQPMQSKNFLQVSPPRIASRVTTALPGNGHLGRMQTVYDGKNALSCAADGRNYFLMEMRYRDGMRFDNGAEMVRRAVLFPRETPKVPAAPKTDRSPLTKEVLATVEESPWSSVPDTLDGKTVIRFSSRTISHYPPNKRRRAASQRTVENTVWADPDTYRIVRRETHTLAEGTSDIDTTIVYDNYRYNVVLPTGVFDVPVPPVGRSFVFHSYTTRAANNWKPSPADTAKIKATLNEAARLWNTKRVDKLFQNWDFGFNSTWGEMFGGTRQTPAKTAEEKRHWKARAEKGIPYKSWQLKGLTVAPQFTGGIYVREKETDPFPPTGRPVNYSATCDVMAQLKPGTKPVPCSMTATFHRVGDDFRITYLNMYDQDMGVGNGIAWHPKPTGKKR